jgi:Icc-related predicted phosphoesterase
MKLKINREIFNNFLKSISLGGIIKEVVLYTGKKILVKCIDEMSVMFILSKIEGIESEENQIGIKDLPLFQKVCSELISKEDLSFDINESSLKISGNRISFTLSPPKEIKTYFNNDKELSKLLKEYKDTTEFSKKDLQELKQYISIFSPEELVLGVEDKKLIASSLEEDSTKFVLNLGDCDQKEIKAVINAKYFNSILNYLFEQMKDKDTVAFSLIDSKPVYIRYKDVIWLLSPM